MLSHNLMKKEKFKVKKIIIEGGTYKMKEKMKLIQRNCLIFAIIGFVLIIIGIGFITNSSSSGGSWSGGWYSNIKKQREQEQQTGVICIAIGLGVYVFDIIYYNHAKANLNNNFGNQKNISVSNDDSASKLRQLKEMYDDGIISKEEFEQKKQKILNNM